MSAQHGPAARFLRGHTGGTKRGGATTYLSFPRRRSRPWRSMAKKKPSVLRPWRRGGGNDVRPSRRTPQRWCLCSQRSPPAVIRPSHDDEVASTGHTLLRAIAATAPTELLVPHPRGAPSLNCPSFEN